MMKIRKVYLDIFLLVYISSGIYMVWPPWNSFFLTTGNLLFYGYIAFPLIVSIFGALELFRGKNINVYMWVCSVYWFVIAFSEIFIEDDKILPSAIFMVSMFVISSLCIVFLIMLKMQPKRLQK